MLYEEQAREWIFPADHGVPVDAICGTSIGAYIGGALAMEWDFQTLRHRIEDFSRKHPLLELVLQLVAAFRSWTARFSRAMVWRVGKRIRRSAMRA
jgi:predicted acylesterase/phospholipase RssA